MKNKFYSGKRALSYGTPFIFSLGNRSTGKSFYWKCRCINMYKQTKRKFIYVRRYGEDLARVAKTFFDDVAFKFPEDEFCVDGNKTEGFRFFINKQLAGIAIPLSAVTRYKSVSLVDYDLLFFDEFLPEDSKYLKDEVGMCFSLYQTVARGDGRVIRPEVRFVFVANNVTLNNPYFNELRIRQYIDTNTNYCVDPDRGWVVELYNNEVVANEIAQTAFGKMIAKTKYGEYALKSAFYLDDPTFIEKPEGNGVYYCTLAWNGDLFGVWEYRDVGMMYISQNVDHSCKIIFALTTKDHKPNYMMLYRQSMSPVYKYFRYIYDNALVRFQNDLCKYMFLEYMNYSV